MNWPEDKLSRFEAARLIGARSLQVALGAPVLIKTENSTPIGIAREEFGKMMIPMTIKRKMPDGKYTVVNSKKSIQNWIDEKNGEI